MKFPIELLEEVVKNIIGDDAIHVLRLMWGKEKISEIKLAEELKLTINQVRNMLYRLNEHNIIYFTRKKDKQKGWYIYFWTINYIEAHDLTSKYNQKKIEETKHLIDKLQSEIYYLCPVDNITYNQIHALENDFRCPEDGQILEQKDNKKEIAKLSSIITKLDANIKLIEQIPRPVIKEKLVKKPTLKITKKPIKKIKKIKKELAKKKTIKIKHKKIKKKSTKVKR